MLSVNFYKNEKMFQIDLNSDLKQEPDLKSRCIALHYFEPISIPMWANMPRCV